MASFEYDMLHIKAEPEGARLNLMNARGADGWEAYAVSEDNTGWWVFLKRPIEELTARRSWRPRRRLAPKAKR